MDNLIITLNEDEYRKLTDNDNNLLFIHFWAPWSGPCNQFIQNFEDLAKHEKSLSEKPVSFAKVNVDLEGELVRIFNIKTVPTFIGLKGRSVVFSEQGIVSDSEFERKIKLLRHA